MVELSPTTTYLADANLFIRAGTPKKKTAEALIAFFSRSHWTLLVHPDIDNELTDEARKFSRHRTLQCALDQDWAEIARLPDDPTESIQDIKDAARKCIAEETNRPHDKIEEEDVNLVAAAAKLIKRDSIDVGIITNDRATGRCFDRVLDDFGYERAEYIDAKQLLQEIHDWHIS